MSVAFLIQRKIAPIVFPVTTEQEFCEWVGGAVPGSWCRYHRGFLMIDTEVGAVRAKAILRRLRDRVWLAYELGQVLLVQRRVGENTFDYLAVSTSKAGRRH
jgi:hypothetical protein